MLNEIRQFQTDLLNFDRANDVNKMTRCANLSHMNTNLLCFKRFATEFRLEVTLYCFLLLKLKSFTTQLPQNDAVAVLLIIYVYQRTHAVTGH